MAAQLDVPLRGILQGGSAMSAWSASINQKQPSGAFWEEEVVQLMMGRPLLHHHLDVTRPSSSTSKNFAPCSTTLDLLGAASSASSSSSTCWPQPPPLLIASEEPDSSSSARCFDLDADAPLPSGWEKCLDLQTGNIYYLNRSTGLSTSCDPRKATTSNVNWPTSPSSSSDLTVEASVPMASSSKPIATSFLEGPSKDPTHLDLTLSLRPSSPCLKPHSLLNHDLNGHFNHKFKSLISSQGPPNKQTFSSLPFNSARASLALPSASSIASSPSSIYPSTLFFQELSALKDMGSLATSMSSKESKSMSMNSQSVNGISRHIISHNTVSMSVREKDFSRETLSSSPISKNFSVSAKAKPIISETHMDVSSSAMMTVGCANCLMFVMLPKSRSPKCPRCGASIDSDLPQPPSLKKPKLGLSLMS